MRDLQGRNYAERAVKAGVAISHGMVAWISHFVNTHLRYWAAPNWEKRSSEGWRERQRPRADSRLVCRPMAMRRLTLLTYVVGEGKVVMSGGNCVAGAVRFSFWEYNQPHTFDFSGLCLTKFFPNNRKEITCIAVIRVSGFPQHVARYRCGDYVSDLQARKIFLLVPDREIAYPFLYLSRRDKSSTEVVAGVPQVVYKIPFDGSASPMIADLDFGQACDRLIVGPTPYPWPIYGAFVEALKASGVANAGERVFVSDIPIRA
jgi:hypothetical protein